jgi:hypothetical protein
MNEQYIMINNLKLSLLVFVNIFQLHLMRFLLLNQTKISRISFSNHKIIEESMRKSSEIWKSISTLIDRWRIIILILILFELLIRVSTMKWKLIENDNAELKSIVDQSMFIWEYRMGIRWEWVLDFLIFTRNLSEI